MLYNVLQVFNFLDISSLGFLCIFTQWREATGRSKVSFKFLWIISCLNQWRREEEDIYFSKQKHSVQSVVCLNTVISNNNNKKNYFTVLKNMYFKYSDIVSDFSKDVVVTTLSFVRLVLTGKLKNTTCLFCFQISIFRDKQVFLSFRLSFVYIFVC